MDRVYEMGYNNSIVLPIPKGWEAKMKLQPKHKCTWILTAVLLFLRISCGNNEISGGIESYIGEQFSPPPKPKQLPKTQFTSPI